MSDLFKPDPERLARSGDLEPDNPTTPIRMSERPAYPTRASLRGRDPKKLATRSIDTRPQGSASDLPARPSRSADSARPAHPTTDPQQPAPAPARHLPKTVAALVALAGLALVAAGILQGTVFKPPSSTTASLGDAPSQPVIVSQIGLMGLDGPRVQITANGNAGKPVFLGIGRASDIQAYLAKAERITVTGEDGQGTLTTKANGSEAKLPDPAGADVWVVSQRGQGAATLNWPDVAGQWVVVAASDGQSAAPDKLTFEWSGKTATSSGAGFIAVGAVLAVCGFVLLVMLISRSRQERTL